MAVPESSREDIAAALGARRELAQRDSFSLKLALGSMVLGIPLSAIGSTEGLTGVAVTWGGIAVVNLAYALRDWRHR